MGPSLTDDVVAIGRLNAAYADVITRRAFAERHYRSLARSAAESVVLGLPARLRHSGRPGR